MDDHRELGLCTRKHVLALKRVQRRKIHWHLFLLNFKFIIVCVPMINIAFNFNNLVARVSYCL